MGRVGGGGGDSVLSGGRTRCLKKMVLFAAIYSLFFERLFMLSMTLAGGSMIAKVVNQTRFAAHHAQAFAQPAHVAVRAVVDVLPRLIVEKMADAAVVSDGMARHAWGGDVQTRSQVRASLYNLYDLRAQKKRRTKKKEELFKYLELHSQKKKKKEEQTTNYILNLCTVEAEQLVREESRRVSQTSRASQAKLHLPSPTNLLPRGTGPGPSTRSPRKRAANNDNESILTRRSTRPVSPSPCLRSKIKRRRLEYAPPSCQSMAKTTSQPIYLPCPFDQPKP